MSQDQEDIVVGRTLRQCAEAEQAFHLLEDEGADVITNLIALASDLQRSCTGRRYVGRPDSH